LFFFTFFPSAYKHLTTSQTNERRTKKKLDERRQQEGQKTKQNKTKKNKTRKVSTDRGRPKGSERSPRRHASEDVCALEELRSLVLGEPEAFGGSPALVVLPKVLHQAAPVFVLLPAGGTLGHLGGLKPRVKDRRGGGRRQQWRRREGVVVGLVAVGHILVALAFTSGTVFVLGGSRRRHGIRSHC